ncbi:MAG: hypothetical protein KGL40_05505 [Rhodocyclaceae bacterium]|nr:hypothetical protein [Rhodocyclaceae bacterium]
MTSPNSKQSLEAVLDEFFFATEKPNPAAILKACEAHPEYRQDILEFAALWSSYETMPEPDEREFGNEISEAAISRLQSFVLNRVHELDSESTADEAAVKAVIYELAGAKLRRATAASGLGESTILLTKILAGRILDFPAEVLAALATHLKVTTNALRRCIAPDLENRGNLKTPSLVGGISYKASSGKPDIPQAESWENAVRALSVSDEEKQRLLRLKK